jgi:hypothetical protein
LFGEDLPAGAEHFHGAAQLNGTFRAREVVVFISFAEFSREFAEEILLASF